MAATRTWSPRLAPRTDRRCTARCWARSPARSPTISASTPSAPTTGRITLIATPTTSVAATIAEGQRAFFAAPARGARGANGFFAAGWTGPRAGRGSGRGRRAGLGPYCTGGSMSAKSAGDGRRTTMGLVPGDLSPGPAVPAPFAVGEPAAGSAGPSTTPAAPRGSAGPSTTPGTPGRPSSPPGLASPSPSCAAAPGATLRVTIDRAGVSSMARYSLANHATNLLGVVPGLVFPLLVAAVLGPPSAGYFYIAWVLANFLFIIPGSVFTSVLAEGSRWRPGLRGTAVDGLFLSLAILVPALAGVVLAGAWLLQALKPTFLAATSLLNVLAASSFFVAINSLYIAVLRVERRMRGVVGLYAGTTVVALALAGPLMLGAGLVGAGLAFAIAQGAGAGYAAVAMIREGLLRRAV